MRTILTSLLDNIRRNKTIILSAIIHSTGSAPRDHGARMGIKENGEIFGTIGGGELEAETIRTAVSLFNRDQSYQLLDFDLTIGQAAMAGMVCGGSQKVLLQKIEPTEENINLFQKLQKGLEQKEKLTLATILKGNVLSYFGLFPEPGNNVANMTGSLTDMFTKKAARYYSPFSLEQDDIYIFAEPLVAPQTVHFAGGGHVAQATAQLAAFVGFRVRVLDDRKEFANPKLFPDADVIEVVEDFADSLGSISATDMVVIVTRGHQHDRTVLRQALKTDAAYIGMIGSRTKREATYAALRKEGFTDQDFARVYSPIGLPIGGDSPSEIGLSIVAQLQQVKYMKE